MRKAYIVEVGDRGCSKCRAGRTWDIVGPDGVATATSYGNKEEAQDIAQELNIAFGRGARKFPIVSRNQ